MCVSRHAQITQNNNFAIFFEISQERSRVKLIFLHADKHENLLQIDTMVFDGDGQALSKFPKQKVCNVFTISIYLQYLDHQIFLNGDTIIIDRHNQAFSNC